MWIKWTTKMTQGWRKTLSCSLLRSFYWWPLPWSPLGSSLHTQSYTHTLIHTVLSHSYLSQTYNYTHMVISHIHTQLYTYIHPYIWLLCTYSQLISHIVIHIQHSYHTVIPTCTHIQLHTHLLTPGYTPNCHCGLLGTAGVKWTIGF